MKNHSHSISQILGKAKSKKVKIILLLLVLVLYVLGSGAPEAGGGIIGSCLLFAI
jgi:hypothetical protein